MASFAFFDAVTAAQTLAADEFGVIGDTGSLEVAGSDAISSSGSVAVTVHGRLFGGLSAIHQLDGVLTLTVGETGRVNAGNDDTVFARDIDRAFVSNDGRIRSLEDALDLRGEGPISILNTGSLLGRSDGIVTASTGSATKIVNDGTITGTDSGGIDHLGGDFALINHGTITGEDYGVDAADIVNDNASSVDEVRNFGSIEGGVLLYALDDIVFNRGEIDVVEMGDGNDIYIGRADGSAGSVDGGGGRDALVGSRADDDFTGGLAGDVFVFARRGGDDRIEDFGGRDRIDLSDFGLSGFSELRPLIEDSTGGALIDLSDRGLTILLVDVDKADLRGSDFFFEVMVS
jgi:hypothetical protein